MTTPIVSLIIGIIVGYFWGKRSGIAAAMKDPRRDKVLKFLDRQGDIANDDVQKLLGVSDATATRYMDDLQKAGLVTQVGQTGSGVVYRRK